MMLRAWGVALLVCASACKGGDSAEERPVEAAPAPVEAQAATPAQATGPDAAAELAPDEAPVEALPPATDSTAADPIAPAPAPPIPAPRDLGAELRAAVGIPADCVKDYRPAYATTIVVRVSAVVRPSGMVIEASASGSGLSINDRRCIEQRVGAVLLEPLAGSTSESVTTSFEVPYEPPAVKSDVVAAPPPPPDDVVEALPKKKPIAPSGVPIDGADAKPIEGPSGQPIDGPRGVPIDGPESVPIHQD
jgi:hypothetical protein